MLEPTCVICTTCSTLDMTFISNSIPPSCFSWEVIDCISEHTATKCPISLSEKPNEGKSTTQIFKLAQADNVSIIDYLGRAFVSFSQRFADPTVSVSELWLSFNATAQDY